MTRSGNREPVLKTDNLSIGYSHRGHVEHTVAQGIDLSLLKGELVCLIGPNGAGKSTLIRTLTGLLPPLAGTVTVEGTPVGELSPRELARRISIVTTERMNLGLFTGYSLVSLGRYPHTDWRGSLTSKDTEAVIQAVKSVGAEELAQRNVNELSDGERQKIMIARALCQEADIMVLDEPTAFLDLPRRVEVMGLLHRLSRERNTSVLISTHELDLALHTADRIVLLSQDGRLVTGAPEDCVLSGAFEDIFDTGAVHFDRRHGNFQITREHREKVALSGKGLISYWTRRALEREGFVVVKTEDGESVFTVECGDGCSGWTFRGSSSDGHFSTLYELMIHLRRLFHPDK